MTAAAPDQLLRHYDIDQRVLALSAMGRPIVLSGVESNQATTRVMLISGHRALARPITGIAAAVFAQVVADDHVVVALASIEDVNPDGAFSSRRETVLGIDVETDHRNRKAAETLALHRAFDQWRTDLIIDVATRASTLASAHHVEIAVRFRPDAEGQPSASVASFAREIRSQLDNSSLSYRVSMSGCVPGSVTDVRDLPVVELTAQSSTDANVIQAMIEATVATYRAASTSSHLTTA